MQGGFFEGSKTQRAQILKKFKIALRDWNFQARLKRMTLSSEIEHFKRATHQTPIFVGIIKVKIEHFKRDWSFLDTFSRPPTCRRHLHRKPGECRGPSPELWWMSGRFSWIWSCGFAKVRQTSPGFAKVRMKARTCSQYTLEPAWVFRRRTNVQQLTCKIDSSNSFYYLFFSFIILELKPLVLKGKVLREKFWKSAKKCEKVWKIMKRFCPLVVAL